MKIIRVLTLKESLNLPKRFRHHDPWKRWHGAILEIKSWGHLSNDPFFQAQMKFLSSVNRKKRSIFYVQTSFLSFFGEITTCRRNLFTFSSLQINENSRNLLMKLRMFFDFFVNFQCFSAKNSVTKSQSGTTFLSCEKQTKTNQIKFEKCQRKSHDFPPLN